MPKSAWAGLGVLLACGTVWSQQYLISTVAGGGVPLTPAAAANAGIGSPAGIAADAIGNVYFSSGHAVYKVDSSGTLARVAGGGTPGYSGDSGQGTAARLHQPQGLALDGGGNLYIADTGNNVIREVTVDGTITTVATGLNAPRAVAVDATGAVWVADTGNNAVLKVGGTGPLQLNAPAGLAFDAAGNLYIADTGNNAIRKLSTNGVLTTVAGASGVAGYSGDAGPATNAHLHAPVGLAFDTRGNLYIADSRNNAIRRIAANGFIATVAGTGDAGFTGDGGLATNARLSTPWGVAVGPSGIFVADYLNYRIRQVASNGTISTLAGTGIYSFDGTSVPATSAQLGQAMAVTADSSGNFYIADTLGNAVRKVATDGTITTVAGTGQRGYWGDGGQATVAQLNRPRGIARDSSGNLYVSDTDNNRVRKVDTNGVITTIAGTGVAGYSGNGGVATAAQLNAPCGLAIDSSGNIFVADFGNNVIREILATNSNIIFAAGSFNPGYLGDGAAATSARLNSPSSVAVDSSGAIYIADYYNHVIRKVDSAGIISTVAGKGTAGYSGDGGPGTSAYLSLPWGVAVGSSGNILIGDTGNNVVRLLNSSGAISTVAGTNVAGYSGDGGAAISAQLNAPGGVAVDSSGNVYVADMNNSLVRLLTPTGSHAVLSVAATHSGDFQPGQNGATFSVLVSNAASAGSTSGTVTVTATLASNVTLASMSGSGWSCSGTVCTRSDALNGGASYPAITLTVNVASSATSQVGIQVSVSGGGSVAASAGDAAVILGPFAAPVLISPPNGSASIPLSPVLSWGAYGATSFDVYFGTSATPPKVTTTHAGSYSPGSLNPETKYYWQIVAFNSAGASTSSAVWSFTTGAPVTALQYVPVTPCRVTDTRASGGPLAPYTTRVFTVQGKCGVPSTAQAYALNVTAVPKGQLLYLTLWPDGEPQPNVSTLNSFKGSVVANAAIVPAGPGGKIDALAAGTTDVVLDVNGYFEPSTSGALFHTVTPCRLADTRQPPPGPFGQPSMSGGQTRDFPVPTSSCNLPADATAYSLNVTAVPGENFLGYLTTWPSGQPQPVVSTLNSFTGAIVANAALVPAGSNGAISVFVTQQADVILDTNGYFAPQSSVGGLSFYPVTPCRVADTRTENGPFGGPAMQGGTTRQFAISQSNCYVPLTASAYSLNITVLPYEPLAYLTAWAAGTQQPYVSTLNSFGGDVVANAAIVQASAGGAINIFVTNTTNVLIDINGYFAP